MLPIRDHNPSERTPYVCYALIALNVAIFLYTVIVAETNDTLRFIYWDYAMIPARIDAGENYISLITSQFLHGGWLHLGGNLLFLWIYGDNLEEEFGHAGFLIFYLACGALAAYAQYLAAPTSFTPTIGASGAIAGVMGGYLLLFPRAKIDILIIFVVFFRIFPLSAWIVLGVWLALQLIGGFGTPADGAGVAYWAHIGGFAAGVLLAAPLWMRRGGTAYWDRTDGHPPHPEATYEHSRIPVIRRR